MSGVPTRRPLGSTYRLQLAGLGFGGATELVGYLHELGIETLYVSPVLAAVPGSTHGYDVVDPTRLDPALGTAAHFEALLAELQVHGMRVLIDIVPNHMATHPENPWWWDVLRHGEDSAFSATFDIDWSVQQGRVLVPTLAEPLSGLLDDGAVTTAAGPGGRGNGPEIVVDGQHFPLSPESEPAVSPVGLRHELEALLARQHFRPAYWRLSRYEGNYRRFFDIDGLIGVRVEDIAVFDATHRFILELAGDDRIAGWRVDHVDGLTDPGAYLGRLRAALVAGRPSDSIVLVEKILAAGEVLRDTWPVDGTTGYEFADAVGRLFVAPDGAVRVEEAGRRIAGDTRTFAQLALASKREVLDRSFPAPLRRLVGLVAAALDLDLPGHDLSAVMIGQALRELTVHFDAYRTYFDEGPPDAHDATRLKRAVASGDAYLDSDGRRALAHIRRGLSDRTGPDDGPSAAIWLQLARRWQQLTGAVTAKGVEDTATYRFSGLLGHAEVGSDPGHPAAGPLEFLAATGPRGRRYPSSLNTTSTHDSKRSEDVRARLFTLSELPDEWIRLTALWCARHAPAIAKAGGPGGHDELVAYQTLAAMWPVDRVRPSATECRRMQDYMVKEAREAKQRTEWTDPDERYEDSLRSFIARAVRSRDDPFAAEMGELIRRIGPGAATNSLATSVLKSVCPGVPDVYQGTELWDFSLTDPDNRRPVDFGARRRALASLPHPGAAADERRRGAQALLSTWSDGRVKLHVLRTLLLLRRESPGLFDRGSYQLLPAAGERAQHVVAVARRRAGPRWVVALVPRLTFTLAGPGRFPTGTGLWGDTTVQLPVGAPTRFVDRLTGVTIEPDRGTLPVGTVLQALPVSVLCEVPRQKPGKAWRSASRSDTLPTTAPAAV